MTFVLLLTNITAMSPAQLLCQSDQLWDAQEDCHLLQAGHCSGRRDHLRLQVPYRG